MADLHPGESVLDLGSGAGVDVLISARRVGPTGTALRARHDRRDARPREGQRSRGRDRERPTSLKGHIEAIPLAAATVDVVLSNCVINLSTDKPQVIAKPRVCFGRAGASRSRTSSPTTDMDDATRGDLPSDVGCVAGALTRDEYTPRSPRPA